MSIMSRETSNPDIGGDDEMTTHQVAELLEVSASTVRRYAEEGYLGDVRVLPSGHRRYRRSAIDALLRRGLPEVPGQ